MGGRIAASCLDQSLCSTRYRRDNREERAAGRGCDHGDVGLRDEHRSWSRRRASDPKRRPLLPKPSGRHCPLRSAEPPLLHPREKVKAE